MNQYEAVLGALDQIARTPQDIGNRTQLSCGVVLETLRTLVRAGKASEDAGGYFTRAPNGLAKKPAVATIPSRVPDKGAQFGVSPRRWAMHR